MKNMMVAACASFLVLCGCHCQTMNHYPICWDGQSVDQFEGKTLEAMLWLRPILNREYEENFPGNYQVYKRFDDSDYQILLECLKNPEVSSTVKDTSWGDYLYLSFLDGTHYVIGFSIRSKAVILPNGYSERLYSLLTEKQVCSTYDADKDSGLVVFPGIRAPTPEHRYRDDWINQEIGQRRE